MRNNTKIIVKIVCIALALLLIGTACAGIFALAADPAEARSVLVLSEISGERRPVTGLNTPRTVHIEFVLTLTDQEISAFFTNSDGTNRTTPRIFRHGSGDALTTTGSVWEFLRGVNTTELTLTRPGNAGNTVNAVLRNVRYTLRGVPPPDTTISLTARYNDGSDTHSLNIDIPIPFSVFDAGGSGNGSGGGGSGDAFPSPESVIMVENVILRGENGNALAYVDEDSPPFILEITFTDYGLIYENFDGWRERDMQVFLTSFDGVIPAAGARGRVSQIASIAGIGAPRFRASFNGMIYNGGSNVVAFQVLYLIDEDLLWSEPTNVTVHQARPAEEEDDDEDNNIAPLRPHIIISSFSYGGEAPAAGETFNLDLTITNTSRTIPLENIIMNITPQIPTNVDGTATGGLSIAAGSNSIFFESMPVGGSINHTVSLRAAPNAAAGNHGVRFAFEFQYVDYVNEVREDGANEENIAIPIQQIDRFSAEVIEITDFLTAGDNGYVLVRILNRGRSSTNNITGTIIGDFPGSGASNFAGNLPPGEERSLDFEIMSFIPGVLDGEIIIQYEDENNDEHEISLPFSIVIEEMFFPTPPGGWEVPEEPQAQGTSTATIVLISIGSLLIAVPIGGYIFKLIRAKGMEELSEDF